MTTRNTKIAPCPTCCPAPYRGDFDRNADGDWSCRNCGHVLPASPRVSKKLADRPNEADLTPSQRRTLAGLRRIGDESSFELRGLGRKVLIVERTPWGTTFFHTVGVRGAKSTERI